MRTTLDLPEKVVLDIVKITKEKSKTKAIVKVMEDYIRRNKLAKVIASAGKVEFELSAEELRRQNER